MSKLRNILFSFLIFSLFSVQSTSAQTYTPSLVLTPDTITTVGTTHKIDLSIVNMGIYLRDIETTVRFSGDMDQKIGLSIDFPDVEKYNLKLKSYYFQPVPNRPDTQDLVISFTSPKPPGYNQGSAQIPLVSVSYTVTPGVFSAFILPDQTRLTDTTGTQIPTVNTPPTRNYRGLLAQSTPIPLPSQGVQDIDTYSLSFESDPIQKYLYTPSQTQYIQAAVWKDSDGANIKKFASLLADWQVDPNFFEIGYTASSYFGNCPIPVVSPRSCILFTAEVQTKKLGSTYVTLKVTNTQTGKSTWNSYSAVVSPQPVVTPTPVGTGDYVSGEEFEAVKQQVTYLQNQLDKQQSLLDRIIQFLRNLFQFR